MYNFVENAERLKSHKGEFTFNALTSTEDAAVRAFVNWEKPEEFSGYIYEVHGRSITIGSPDMGGTPSTRVLEGDFRGLQIIGAGGSKKALQNGIFEINSVTNIEPVDEANHAEELEEILQLRKVDEHGEFVFWQRPYAPLHGMDKGEAVRRRDMTRLLRKHAEQDPTGEVIPFIPPLLAAEGIYPGKLDPSGDPLHFQVYRVPIVRRFPGQILRQTTEKGLHEAVRFLGAGSAKMGETLRIFHENNLAYMDGHMGNISLLGNAKRERLFITDLGSIESITNPDHQGKYEGFDIYMYLHSVRKLLESYAPFLVEHSLVRDKMSAEGLLLHQATSALLCGYYREELASLYEKSPGNLDTEVNQITMTILEPFLTTSPQKFMDFFAGYTKQR